MFFIQSGWGVLDLFQNADGFILVLKNFCKKLRASAINPYLIQNGCFIFFHYRTHKIS